MLFISIYISQFNLLVLSLDLIYGPFKWLERRLILFI